MKRHTEDSSKEFTKRKMANGNRNSSQTMCKEITVPLAGTTNALNINRKFYKDPPYGNLMFDPRVCRGSPFAQSRVARAAGGDARDDVPPPRRTVEIKEEEEQWRPITPPPMDGRQHFSVQTDRYLELLFDFPEKVDVECQTDLFMDYPSPPYYVTEKVGEDEETQILPGDLWDFDREVHPIVEVLVGRTLELAMVGVLEEDEIENMKIQQRRFEELREGERAEQRRLEEQERRLQEEKDRRIKQYEEAMRIQKEMSDRVAAAMLTQGYLGDLLPNVLEGLTTAGYILEDIRADVQEHVIPWLIEETNQQMEMKTKVHDIIASIVRSIVEARALTYRLLGEEDDQNHRQPCIPLDMPSTISIETAKLPEYIKDMGPEECEPPQIPETPMKGVVKVRRGARRSALAIQGAPEVAEETGPPEIAEETQPAENEQPPADSVPTT